MNISRFIFSAILCLVVGCDGSDANPQGGHLDCRNVGMDCNRDFRCQMNSAGLYECLPDTGSTDATASLDSGSDAGAGSVQDGASEPDVTVREHDALSVPDVAVNVDATSGEDATMDRDGAAITDAHIQTDARVNPVPVDMSVEVDVEPVPRCGDGIINGAEECDDENLIDSDACTNGCQAARCGDGIIHEGQEQCDGGDGCTGDCTPALDCPNGMVGPDGECIEENPASCFELLTPADNPNPEFIFTACPTTISVADCRVPMMAILQRNPAAQLCPFQSGAAAGEGWCPVRGFAAACWGYVGTGGDANTACDTGAEEFARAFIRNAATDEERASCAVVTAVMSHEGGFAPTAKSWDMFCNGGNTGATGLFQFDFASGLDPLPAGIDSQFQQFFRGAAGPTLATLSQAWMACNPRIAGATAATLQDLQLSTAACRAAGAPQEQRAPGDLGCRFVGVEGGPDAGGADQETRCGVDWLDANTRCATLCANNENCPAGESCFTDLSLDPCGD